MSALNDPAFLETLGYAQIGTAAGDLNLATFDAQPVSSGDVIVKFTYYGDANLDGNVNSTDESMITTGQTGWTNGDFNYDGTVDGSDFSLLDVMTNTLTGQNQNVPSGTIALAADANFPVSSLPTITPTGDAISNWGRTKGDASRYLTAAGIAARFRSCLAPHASLLVESFIMSSTAPTAGCGCLRRIRISSRLKT